MTSTKVISLNERRATATKRSAVIAALRELAAAVSHERAAAVTLLRECGIDPTALAPDGVPIQEHETADLTGAAVLAATEALKVDANGLVEFLDEDMTL